MTAKPQPRATGLGATGSVMFEPHEERAVNETSAHDNFSNVMSEALAKGPAKASTGSKGSKAVADPKTNQTDSRQTGQTQTPANTSKTKTTADANVADEDASKDGKDDSADVTPNEVDGLDTTAASVVMALLIQPAKPTEVPVKLMNLSTGSAMPSSDVTPKVPITIVLPPITPAASTAPTAANSTEQTSAPLKEQPPPQLVDSKELKSQIKGVDPTVSPDGMTAALSRQSMKFVAEKNEIAGRTEQKLPHAPLTGDASSVSTALADGSDAQPDFNAPSHKNEFSWTMPTANFTVSSSVLPTSTGSAPEAASRVDSQAQVDRLSRMVSEEVITIRQTGASAVAVSLKVDAHTELSLQLTNHDGQIQASLRCERGSVTGMENHWGQLQESLAKQNIQLQPLESKGSATNTPFNSNNGSQFNQSSENPQRQRANPADDMGVEMVATKTVSSRNSKNKTSSAQGWESWA